MITSDSMPQPQAHAAASAPASAHCATGLSLAAAASPGSANETCSVCSAFGSSTTISFRRLPAA